MQPPIKEFEAYVFQRQYEQAAQWLLSMFGHCETDPKMFESWCSNKVLCTRFVHCLVHLMSDDKFIFSLDGYEKLIAYNHLFIKLIRQSGFVHLRHALSMVGIERSPGQFDFPSENHIARFLLLASTESLDDSMLTLLLNHAPILTVPALLAVLSHPSRSPTDELGVRLLHEKIPQLSGVQPRTSWIPLIVRGYVCNAAITPIAQTLNTMLNNWFVQQKTPPEKRFSLLDTANPSLFDLKDWMSRLAFATI